MQTYLVTLQPNADVDKFLSSAKKIGCFPSDDAPPIPMKNGETVVTLEGASDARNDLGSLPFVQKASRSSEMYLQ